MFSILSLGCILILDLVTSLFMHSLPEIILLYLAAPFLHQRCFCMRYHHLFCKVHALLQINNYWLTYSYPGRSWSIDTSVSALSCTHNKTFIVFFNLKQEMQQIYYINITSLVNNWCTVNPRHTFSRAMYYWAYPRV